MRRREFLASSTAMAAIASVATSTNPSVDASSKAEPHTFKLNYAPHFNMFRNSAGEDLIDQLKFAADHGFTAWEDNGMKSRPVDLQELSLIHI